MPDHADDPPPLADALARLIDRWCARRELGALAELLPAYVAFDGHADSLVDLHEALRAAHAYARGHLPEDEEAELERAARLAAEALRAANAAGE